MITSGVSVSLPSGGTNFSYSKSIGVLRDDIYLPSKTAELSGVGSDPCLASLAQYLGRINMVRSM